VDPHALPFQMSAVLVVLITAAATMFRKQVPALLAVWLAYAAALLPVLGIVNAFKQIVADRYSYLACMGLEILAGACFLVVWNRAAKMRAGRAVAALVAITMVGVLGALSWKQVGIWKDPETFWTYTLSVEPSFLALDGMGVVLAQRGDYPGAIQYLRESIAVDPDYEFSHNNLAAALSSLGNYEEAAKEFEAALALKPNLSISQNGWGYALLMQGKLDEAIEHFRLAVSIDPGNEEARNNLERALALKTK
jgi:tetratricopeptide (TPR) repeat protein